MAVDTTDALERRIRALEAANRRLRAVMLAVVVGVAALLTMGSSTETERLEAKVVEADEVHAAEFVVTTSSGTARATIRARSDGRQGLEIRTSSGKTIFEVE